MTDIEKVIQIAIAELDYIEKGTRNKEFLYDKKANAGSNNYTKYWEDIYPAFQGQPWCMGFVHWVFRKAFSAVIGAEILFDNFNSLSFYTPTSAQYFKNNGKFFNTAKVGDLIFFKNSTRIHHVGIVVALDNDNVYTIEGNTSDGTSVVANGGKVCKKVYSKKNPAIAGYGRPNWSSNGDLKYTPKTWYKDNKGWWYAKDARNYARKEFLVINHAKYYFDDEGYAVTGAQIINGKRYFFEDTTGAPKECAMMITDKDNSLKILYV